MSSAGSEIDTEWLVSLARDGIDVDATERSALRKTPDGFDRASWRNFAELGWAGLLVSDASGGGDASMAEAAAIARVLGEAGRTEPFVSTSVIATRWLQPFSDTERVAALLQSIALGETIITPLCGQTPAADGTHALTGEFVGGDLIVSGEVAWSAPVLTDALLAPVRTSGGTVLIEVEPSSTSLEIQTQRMADETRTMCCRFREFRATDSAILARDQRVDEAIVDGVLAGVLATSAQLEGTIRHMVVLTLAYLRTRSQFGQLIGSFQALQHKAVDMWVQQELTAAAVASAAAAFSEAPNDPASAKAVHGAKARASSAAMFVANQAIQLHGAIGFTDEYELGHFVNRSLVLANTLGNPRYHRRRFAELSSRSDSRQER